ncbi:putative golgin candidate 5 [Cocos nucifera]|uniref:Putative golgin candidate 5 n=1 Tax=Cocos nucifera TaxID=13894 RepID=A0A8K0NC49_COCNU|nr:putative golgin candidate 5 [Cocos nucifera]
MARTGKVSLGGFPDLAGAVTKLRESVKNIEKNFDSALGLEEKPEAGAEGAWGSASEGKGLFDLGAFIGHIGDESAPEASIKEEPLGKEDSTPSSAEEYDSISSTSAAETASPVGKVKEDFERKGDDVDPYEVDISSDAPGELDDDRADAKSDCSQAETNLSTARSIYVTEFVLTSQQKADAEVGRINELWAGDSKLTSSDGVEQIENIVPSTSNELHHVNDLRGSHDKHETEADKGSPDKADVLDNGQVSL